MIIDVIRVKEQEKPNEHEQKPKETKIKANVDFILNAKDMRLHKDFFSPSFQ